MGYTHLGGLRPRRGAACWAVFAAPMVGMMLAKFDPRKLIFAGLIWLAIITWLRASVNNDYTYWQISTTGLGLPFVLDLRFWAASSRHETASAAGSGTSSARLRAPSAPSVVQTV